MSASVQPHPLILVWANKLLDSHFRTDAYRTSRIEIAGRRLHLIDALTGNLASQLQALFDARGLVATPVVFRHLDRGAREYSGLSADGDALAQVVYLTQLHADLLDRGDLRRPGARHREAQADLWEISKRHLERASFAGTRTPGFWRLVEVARRVSIDKDELYQDFWTSRIWPNLIEGDDALREAAALHGVIQPRARSFISNRIKVYSEQIRHYVTHSVLTGKSDRNLDDILSEHAIDVADAVRHRTASWYDTEGMALENIWLDDYVRRVLDIYAAAAKENRLGLLIHLFRAYMMPNVSSVGHSTGGKNQQIAAVLNHWRQDNNALMVYLTDEARGLWLDESLARTIVDVVQRGFDEVPDPIDETLVTRIYNKFNTATRPRLHELFPSDDINTDADAP